MTTLEQIIIRRAVPADIPALVGLLGLLFSIEHDFTIDAAKQERGLHLLLAESRAAVLVAAEAEGQVIGFCTGQLLISTAEGGPAAVIEDVVVLPNKQRQGVGKRLLLAISAWAASFGANRLHLLADCNNAPALAFYKRVGWEITALVCLRTYIKENGNER
jgi:ribosomal protein S18 acetylase RimI-like enzyme